MIRSNFRIRFLMPTILLAAVHSGGAAILANLPTPVDQGGMIHINISLQGSVLAAHVEPGVPVLQGLSLWSPGDGFDPGSPWHATLDPAAGAGQFNSRFGFNFETNASDDLPEGSRIVVNLLSATAGLEIYRWRNNAPQMFSGILGSGGSPAEWDWSSVNLGMMHPMFVVPAGSSGSAGATLRFTLTDAGGSPLAGYTPATATLDFIAVPEAAAVALAVPAVLVLAARRRRHPPES